MMRERRSAVYREFGTGFAPIRPSELWEQHDEITSITPPRFAIWHAIVDRRRFPRPCSRHAQQLRLVSSLLSHRIASTFSVHRPCPCALSFPRSVPRKHFNSGRPPSVSASMLGRAMTANTQQSAKHNERPPPNGSSQESKAAGRGGEGRERGQGSHSSSGEGVKTSWH